ncbi:MAG: 16S rRNA (guanine(966)-N(2))-methyltransferase RsmD [Hydrogenophilales bacterium 12-61-10]|nr:MAG: 16S rRNA (guanine(966)-N(2))-methyltransferase RsmD [Hydrogenophilales bacterium 12-61-10]
MLAKRAAPNRAHGAANRVRIIGGQYRRRLLDFPDADGLRPTPDRVRETLFNWLGQDLPGWGCLDLFAGSGALGFEAASRGAARVVMVERDARAVRALEANRTLLEGGQPAARHIDILRADALAWLANNRETFELIFIDPPFDSGLAATVLPDLDAHLKPGGHVYIEQALPVVAPPGLVLQRSGRAGRSHFALLIKDKPC